MRVVDFRQDLKTWGKEHFRCFPWRLTRNPYQILIAELMLHRTRVNQVLNVYDKFIHQYKDLETLAETDEKELMTYLFSLGLHWRSNLIHKMACEIMERFQGKIPVEKETLKSLPGISDYIASAVRCFAWEFPDPLVDTNTTRVIGRLYGIQVKESSRRNTRFRELISGLMDPIEPVVYNYALLDLAGEICTSNKTPNHYQCPVKSFCASYMIN